MTLSQVVAARQSRRGLLRVSLAAAGLAALPSFAFLPSPARADGGEVRIGYQKGSSNLLVLKAQDLLAPVFDPLGYTVTWTEFQAGPPLLEALNAGALDFGTTGAPPPIFAQAAGADLIYAAATTPSPLEEGILVPQDSAIQTVADLKGKKVAVAKGSSANAFLAYALESAGLAWGEVEATYLLPADAKAALMAAASMPGRSGIPTRLWQKTPAMPAPLPMATRPTTRTAASTWRPAPSQPITPRRWPDCFPRWRPPMPGPPNTRKRSRSWWLAKPESTRQRSSRWRSAPPMALSQSHQKSSPSSRPWLTCFSS